MKNNVSTKSRKCKKCSTDFKPQSNRQLYCADCKTPSPDKPSESERRLTFDLDKAVKSNSWVSGIGVYRLIADKKTYCEKCGSEKFLLIHHKDGDRKNNKPDNLGTLCKKCHQIEHKCWNVLPKGEELRVLKKEQASKAKRDEFGRFIKTSPKV